MSAGNLMAGIIFSAVGFAAFIYGKKQSDLKVLGLGIVLMMCPYFIPNTIALYVIGTALTVGLFIFHD